MGRRTEHEEARDILANLKNRAFRICESKPKADAHYLEGTDATEWIPISDRRAVALLEMLILTLGDKP